MSTAQVKEPEFVSVRQGTIQVCDIIWDPTIYPRCDVDHAQISNLKQIWQVNGKFDPLILEHKTNRIIDGTNRWKVLCALGVQEIEVIWYRYKSDADALLHAAILNHRHGVKLSGQDLAMVVRKLCTHGLTQEQITQALGLNTRNFERFKAQWASVMGKTIKSAQQGKVPKACIPRQASVENGNVITLKFGTRHLAGSTISPKQAEANVHYCGMAQIYVINQVILLIEGSILERGNEQVLDALRRLGSLLKKHGWTK